MIPKEIIEKWEREAETNSSYDLFIGGYIQGRTDQYNEQVREIERLRDMLEVHYKIYCRSAMCDTLDKEEIIKYSNASWQQFKQQHNL